MIQKSLKLNAFLNAFKTIATLFFPLVTFPYSSRILGPDYLGKVNFAQSFVSYFAIIAGLGISSYATREAAKIRDDREKLSAFVKEIFRINMVATFVAYGILGVSLFFVRKLYDYKAVIIICSTLILFTTIGINWLYQAVEDYFYITVRSLVFQVISVILLFTFVKSKDDYLMYAAINVISNVGSNLCNFIHSRKYLNFNVKIKLQYKKHLKPIFILFAAAITNSIFSAIDTTMLGFICDDTEVGVYSAGTKIVHMINGLFPAIIGVLFPRISYYFGNSDYESIYKLSSKTINVVFCLAVPIVIGLFLLAEPIIYILCGNQYLSAVLITKAMCPYILFSAIIAVFYGTILVAMSRENVQLILIAVSAVVNVLLNLLFIYKLAAVGAAIATVLAQSILMVLTLFYMKSFVIKIRFSKNLLQVLLSSIVMGIAVYFVRNLFSNLLLQIFLPFVAGVVVYAFMLFALRNRLFLETMGEIGKKLRKK